MADKILMPKELTAENGAKIEFIGEFFEDYKVTCNECGGEGCCECDNEGYFMQRIFVSWTNIKEIYKKAVELFGEEPH